MQQSEMKSPPRQTAGRNPKATEGRLSDGKTMPPAQFKVNQPVAEMDEAAVGASHSDLSTSATPQDSSLQRTVARFYVNIIPTDCPRFERCSRLICPLDADWQLRRCLDGERVCFYFTEALKRGVRLPKAPALPSKLRRTIVVAYPAIVSRYGGIRHRLRNAAITSSRLGRRPGKKAKVPR
jgi:hypothetical protein